MKETAGDLIALQAVLDASIAGAGTFLRESFQMPEHSLSAGQLVTHLGGVLTVVLATVTAKGEPRVAPIGALLMRGRFVVPTLRTSARARHVATNPAVSLTCFEGVDLAVIVHGTAVPIGVDDGGFDALDGTYEEETGSSVRSWGRPEDALFLAVDARVIFTFARHPERFEAG